MDLRVFQDITRSWNSNTVCIQKYIFFHVTTIVLLIAEMHGFDEVQCTQLNMIDLSVTGCLLKMEFKYIEPQLVPCHSYCSSVPTNLDYYNFCNKYRSECFSGY